MPTATCSVTRSLLICIEQRLGVPPRSAGSIWSIDDDAALARHGIGQLVHELRFGHARTMSSAPMASTPYQ